MKLPRSPWAQLGVGSLLGLAGYAGLFFVSTELVWLGVAFVGDTERPSAFERDPLIVGGSASLSIALAVLAAVALVAGLGLIVGSFLLRRRPM